MPFRSQDQWRWAFANKKRFADRWAKETETPFRALPKKKASTGGDFSAGAGEQITGNRCRDANGHFAPCDEVQGQTQEVDPMSSMAAWNTAVERQRLISNEEKKLRKQQILQELGLAKPEKGGAISAAERKRQQREEQKKNEANTHAAVGPGAQLGLELSKFADPDNPGLLNNLTANKLAEYGLVESGRMGNYYITGEGRAYLSAARSGDTFAAREAFQRAREAYQGKLEQEQAQAEEQQFQQVIEQLEGSPRERRLRLAQERYDKMMNPKQPKAPKAPKPPKDNVTYGSGKVIAGKPKSTVKSSDGDENMYYPPKHVLNVMVRGALLANRFNLQDNFLYYAEKAFNGNPFTINDIKQMHQLHTIRESYKSNDDYGLAYMIRYQLIGGPAGFHWMDSIVQTVDSVMRMKAVSADDRMPSLSASTEAIRGLDLQHYFKRGGNPEMLKLSRKIANRDALSDDEIRQMHKYLVANENTKRDGDVSNPSTSHIEWQMHGSDEGLKWSRDAVARLLNETYKEEKIDMIPSQSAASTAMRGLDLHHYFKRGGSPDLLTLARKLANKKELQPEDVRKMHTYLRAHENSKRDGSPTNPSDSYITWMLHGGEDGLKWANDRIDRLRMSRTKPEYKSSDINFSPPDGVRAAAKRGLELRSKFNRGGTSVGIARARDLSNGKNMSPQTIRRMNSFFARHAVDKRPNWSDPSKPSNGYIAHLLWGGDAGRAWASKVSRQLDAREKSYSIDDQKKNFDLTTNAVAYKHLRGRHNQMSHGEWAEGMGGGGGGGISSGSNDEMVLGNVNNRRSSAGQQIEQRRLDHRSKPYQENKRFLESAIYQYLRSTGADDRQAIAESKRRAAEYSKQPAKYRNEINALAGMQQFIPPQDRGMIRDVGQSFSPRRAKIEEYQRAIYDKLIASGMSPEKAAKRAASLAQRYENKPHKYRRSIEALGLGNRSEDLTLGNQRRFTVSDADRQSLQNEMQNRIRENFNQNRELEMQLQSEMRDLAEEYGIDYVADELGYPDQNTKDALSSAAPREVGQILGLHSKRLRATPQYSESDAYSVRGAISQIRNPSPFLVGTGQIPEQPIIRLSKSKKGQELLRKIVDELAKEKEEQSNPDTRSFASDMWEFIKKILDKVGEEGDDDEGEDEESKRYVQGVISLARKYGISVPSRLSMKNMPYQLIRTLQSVAPQEYANLLR